MSEGFISRCFRGRRRKQSVGRGPRETAGSVQLHGRTRWSDFKTIAIFWSGQYRHDERRELSRCRIQRRRSR